MNRYRAYGLDIASAIALPELPPARGSATDVELAGGPAAPPHAAPVALRHSPDGTAWLECRVARDGYHLRFARCADFHVSRCGERVRFRARRGTPSETLRHLFLDQVMPLLINLRGGEALHASAVRLPAGVVAFAGESGCGKSTVAGAFHVAGYAIVADDCVALRMARGRAVVESAYPGLRLWEDSARHLFDSEGAAPVAHYSPKVRVPAGKPGGRAARLAAVYLLERGRGEPRIEPLNLRDAAMGLIRAAFRLDIADRGMLLRQMRTLEAVARAVPVRRLRLGGGLRGVRALPDAVLRDLEPR